MVILNPWPKNATVQIIKDSADNIMYYCFAEQFGTNPNMPAFSILKEEIKTVKINGDDHTVTEQSWAEGNQIKDKIAYKYFKYDYKTIKPIGS